MIIVDTALARRAAEGKPVRVALVGGGYMARCIALQIVSAIRGMKLVAIANRTVAKAETAYREAGVSDPVHVSSVADLQKAIEQDRYAVTDDAMLVCQAGNIDAVIEATGHVEFGTRVPRTQGIPPRISGLEVTSAGKRILARGIPMVQVL